MQIHIFYIWLIIHCLFINIHETFIILVFLITGIQVECYEKDDYVVDKVVLTY